jgi:hypothetical protein
MNEKITKIAKKMAQKSIYDDVKYLGKWNGYDVYEPTFNDDEEHCIGIPQFLLAKGKILRWTKNQDESFAIVDKLVIN